MSREFGHVSKERERHITLKSESTGSFHLREFDSELDVEGSSWRMTNFRLRKADVTLAPLLDHRPISTLDSHDIPFAFFYQSRDDQSSSATRTFRTMQTRGAAQSHHAAAAPNVDTTDGRRDNLIGSGNLFNGQETALNVTATPNSGLENILDQPQPEWLQEMCTAELVDWRGGENFYNG
jgi:hypothetical protein